MARLGEGLPPSFTVSQLRGVLEAFSALERMTASEGLRRASYQPDVLHLLHGADSEELRQKLLAISNQSRNRERQAFANKIAMRVLDTHAPAYYDEGEDLE